MIGNSKVYHFESKTLRDKNNFKYFDSAVVGSKSSKIFLKKWGITIKFFRKYYLKSDTIYDTELKEPKRNLSYLFNYLLCKLNYFYVKLLN